MIAQGGLYHREDRGACARAARGWARLPPSRGYLVGSLPIASLAAVKRPWNSVLGSSLCSTTADQSQHAARRVTTARSARVAVGSARAARASTASRRPRVDRRGTGDHARHHAFDGGSEERGDREAYGDPDERVRGAGHASPIARRVAGPTMPSATSPRAAW